MLKKDKIAALVPMKWHSERIPGKNIKAFNGKPLLYWVLNSISHSLLVDGIFVDTDSAEISKLCRSFFPGISIIQRPKDLVGDDVSMNKIIGYDLSQISGYEIFVQTHSTNPLLTSETIDKAIRMFLKSKDNDSLFSVDALKSRFYDYEHRPINHDPEHLINTQDLHPLYMENSNLYVFNRTSFEKTGRRIGLKPIFYPMNKLESIDIDTPEDFMLAESISRMVV